MGLIKDFIDRRKERDSRRKEFEENDRMVHNVEERKLSHNERALAKSLEEERQGYIREALILDAKKRKLDDMVKSRNMMKFNPNMFNNGSILKNDKSFLGRDEFLWS